MLRTGLGLSATNYAQSLASASGNMRIFLSDWSPTAVFIRDAWRTLETNISTRIEPELFMESLVKKSLDKRSTIEGLEDIGVKDMSNDGRILRFAEYGRFGESRIRICKCTSTLGESRIRI